MNVECMTTRPPGSSPRYFLNNLYIQIRRCLTRKLLFGKSPHRRVTHGVRRVNECGDRQFQSLFIFFTDSIDLVEAVECDHVVGD